MAPWLDAEIEKDRTILKSVPLAKWMFTQYPWTWPYLGIGSLQTWSSSDKVILLVHSGCCNKIPRVAYKQQIYFTPFLGLEILDQGASMVRWGCFSLPQTFCKMEPSLPNHLPKVPPPNTITLYVRISTYESWRDTNIWTTAPRNSKRCQDPTEARSGKRGFLPSDFGEGPDLLGP